MATWGPLPRPSIPVSLPTWARLSVRARLGLACLLCALPLGLLWSVNSTTSLAPGIQLTPAYCHFGDYAYQYGSGEDGGGLQLVPLDPSETYPNCGGPSDTNTLLFESTAALGYQEPVRLFFVTAALAFGYAAGSRRTALTRRLVGIGLAATAIAALEGVNALRASGADRVAAVCTALALALVVPIVWSRRSTRASVSTMTMPPPGGGYPDPQGQQPGSYPQQGAYPSQGGYPSQGAYPPPGAYQQQGAYQQPGAYPPADQVSYGAPAARRPGGATAAVVVLALVSVVAVVIGLSLKVSGVTGWHNVQAWGGLAVLGGLLTLAPALGGSVLSPDRARQVAGCGAGALVLFWVLFVLPAVGTNASLIVTIGIAAGVIAAWVAPGRTAETGRGPQDHTW